MRSHRPRILELSAAVDRALPDLTGRGADARLLAYDSWQYGCMVDAGGGLGALPAAMLTT